MITVLCVDDSAVMRKMVANTLQASGLYRCIEAADGKQGLEVMEKERPDIIITDYNMPVMNGLDFTIAVRLQEHHRYTPILLLTTETNEALRQSAREKGATGWMVKPFNPEKLLRTIEKVWVH